MPRKRSGPKRRGPEDIAAAIIAALVDGKPRQILELAEALNVKRGTLNFYLKKLAEENRVHRRGLGQRSMWHLGPPPVGYVAKRVTGPPGRRHEGPRSTVSSWVDRGRDGFTSSMTRHFEEQTEQADNIKNYDPEHTRPAGRPRGEVETIEVEDDAEATP
jgi:hypothetical protein